MNMHNMRNMFYALLLCVGRSQIGDIFRLRRERSFRTEQQHTYYRDVVSRPRPSYRFRKQYWRTIGEHELTACNVIVQHKLEVIAATAVYRATGSPRKKHNIWTESGIRTNAARRTTRIRLVIQSGRTRVVFISKILYYARRTVGINAFRPRLLFSYERFEKSPQQVPLCQGRPFGRRSPPPHHRKTIRLAQ